LQHSNKHTDALVYVFQYLKWIVSYDHFFTLLSSVCHLLQVNLTWWMQLALYLVKRSQTWELAP